MMDLIEQIRMIEIDSFSPPSQDGNGEGRFEGRRVGEGRSDFVLPCLIVEIDGKPVSK